MTPEEAESWLQISDDYELDLDTVCDALETIASLRYEYAAQVEQNGKKYIITDSIDGPWLCGDDFKVFQNWYSSRMDAKDYADSWNWNEGKRDGTTARVVRRLVSEPEVAE